MKKWWADAAVVLVVFATAALWGAAYCRASAAAGRQPFFYQSTYEPAVMIACGRGFTVAASPRPGLNRFLATQVDRFACSELPSDLALVPATGQPALSKHLMIAVGWFWSATEISWSGLAAFGGILFGVATSTAYALFRLGTNRAFAAAGAAVLMISPLQLLNLPNVADYSKTPFMLAMIALTAAVGHAAHTPARLLASGAAFGLVLGIGYGFRSDVIVLLPAFAVSAIAFAPGTLRRTIVSRAAAVGVCLLVFAITAWPLLRQRSQSGSCQGHVAILGLMSDFTRALGIITPSYDVGHVYHDMFAYETVVSFAHRRGAPGLIEYCSPAHDAAARDFLFAVATQMPADMLVRTYASARKVPELPFGWPDPPLPGWYDTLYEWRRGVVDTLQSSALLWVSAAVVLVTLADLRLGLLMLFLTLYLGAFPVVQFANRHHFFLEFLTLWCALFVLNAGCQAVRRRGHLRALLDPRRVALAVSLPLGVVAVMFVALSGARALQQQMVTRLLDGYLTAPRAPLNDTDLPFAEPARLGLGQPAALLLATVDPAQCSGDVQLIFQYDDTHPDERFFTRQMRVAAAAPGPVRVFAPTYRGFQRVIAVAQPEKCLASIERVYPPEPLWVYATLAADWREMPLFQRLTGVLEPYHESGQ